jgi:hypothetical protein
MIAEKRFFSLSLSSFFPFPPLFSPHPVTQLKLRLTYCCCSPTWWHMGGMCWAAESRGGAEACQGPASRPLLWLGLCACLPVLFLLPTGEPSNMMDHSHAEECSQHLCLLPTCLPAGPAVCLSVRLSVCLSVCLSVRPSLCLFDRLCRYSSICLYFVLCVFVHPSTCIWHCVISGLCVCLSVIQSEPGRLIQTSKCW